MTIQESVSKKLLVVEKFAPSVTARAWGVLQNPLAELRGWRILKLTANQIELEVSRPLAAGIFLRLRLLSSTTDLIGAAEFALSTLWKRHFSGMGRRLEVIDCHLERVNISEQGFKILKARTELTEQEVVQGSRQLVLGVAGSGGDAGQIEQNVLFFDQKDILAARAKFIFKLKRSEEK